MPALEMMEVLVFFFAYVSSSLYKSQVWRLKAIEGSGSQDDLWKSQIISSPPSIYWNQAQIDTWSIDRIFFVKYVSHNLNF